MVLNSSATKYYFLVAKIYGLDVASFSGLSRFYLPFAFTTVKIHGNSRPAKNGQGLDTFIM